jgi:type I pantothenate kinase
MRRDRRSTEEPKPATDLARYSVFGRAEWAALRSNTPLTLSAEDLAGLRSVNEQVSLDEVADIYLPLTRLLNLHVSAARNLGRVKDTFLGRPVSNPPYVIAIAGSVAVGKSSFARVLQAVLARWPDHPRVALVTTDGFLHPNAVLEERGLMQRKGFPESYDLHRLIRFLAEIKAGVPSVKAPVYSHLTYDLVLDQWQTVDRPDILIFEGLNVLQTGTGTTAVTSDFFDFSVYLDAEEADIEAWYFDRFKLLQQTAFQDPASYFYRYRDVPPDVAHNFASAAWRDINLVNLRQNIRPTRERAHLVLRKRADHSVGEVWLRQV